MQNKSKDLICEAKLKCIDFESENNLELPEPRNKLDEELENKILNKLLELTMDRLEKKYRFSKYNIIKGCEEFIEYRVPENIDLDRHTPSYQLLKFSEEILALMEDLKK